MPLFLYNQLLSHRQIFLSHIEIGEGQTTQCETQYKHNGTDNPEYQQCPLQAS